jgi:hypothetical protein
MPLYALIHEDGTWATAVCSLDQAIKEALESYQYTMIFEHVTDIWKIPPVRENEIETEATDAAID